MFSSIKSLFNYNTMYASDMFIVIRWWVVTVTVESYGLLIQNTMNVWTE